MSFADAVQWSEERLLGFLYSNSFCSPHLLQDRRSGFEADFHALWPKLAPEGVVAEALDYACVFAWM